VGAVGSEPELHILKVAGAVPQHLILKTANAPGGQAFDWADIGFRQRPLLLQLARFPSPRLHSLVLTLVCVATTSICPDSDGRSISYQLGINIFHSSFTSVLSSCSSFFKSMFLRNQLNCSCRDLACGLLI
jgi:hypothetical protein